MAATTPDDADQELQATAQGCCPALSRGSSGTCVRKVQRRLRYHGHSLAVDGIFGPGTETAVKRFQRSKGLVADGIVGPKTYKALFGKACVYP